jgi:hypothetical protein
MLIISVHEFNQLFFLLDIDNERQELMFYVCTRIYCPIVFNRFFYTFVYFIYLLNSSCFTMFCVTDMVTENKTGA